MRRGRLSRYIKPTVLYMGELTTTDCYASAYYLYRISEMLAGAEEQFEQQVELFFKLAIRLKCTEAISNYLEKMVEKAEKAGKLTRFQFPGDFGDHELKINQTVVDLYRCLYVDNEFLPQLIANFLLKSPCMGKEKIQNGRSKTVRLPAKVKSEKSAFTPINNLLTSRGLPEIFAN